MLSLLTAFIAVAVLPFTAQAASAHSNGLARRQAHANLHSKRASGAWATNYDITTGEVACGGFYQPSDWVIAMNQGNFDGACGKKVTISYQGKQTTATVVDECGTTGCLHNGIDLTNSLFEFFAPLSVGVLTVDWWFGDSSPPPPPPPTTSQPPPPPPTTTSTHSTYIQPTSTWTPPPPPTTTSHSTSSTATSSSKTSTSSTSTSTSSSAAPTPTQTGYVFTGNLQGVLDAVILIGKTEVASAK